MNQSNHQNHKVSTARLSVISNTLLVMLKLIVGFTLGSVSIISEAIHSGMDLFASLIALFSVKKSSEPPDREHEYGHGKFEDISGLVEAILIFVAAILIIREAALQLLSPETEILDPLLLYAGIAVMGISAVINWYVSSRLMKVAKETESIALESDAWHLRTGVYTSLGVFAGLILLKITGIVALDSLVAIGVGFVIIKTAFDLTIRSYNHLIDHRITDDEEARIRKIICEHTSEYVSYHNLRTRRAGPEIFIDFHLVLEGKVPVEQAHDLTDHLESDLNTEFPNVSITIHVEPCKGECQDCENFCENRKLPIKCINDHK
jgi:cation diffusion facilitator family transporter